MESLVFARFHTPTYMDAGRYPPPKPRAHCSSGAVKKQDTMFPLFTRGQPSGLFIGRARAAKRPRKPNALVATGLLLMLAAGLCPWLHAQTASIVVKDLHIENGTVDPEWGYVKGMSGFLYGGDPSLDTSTNIVLALGHNNLEDWIITPDGLIFLPTNPYNYKIPRIGDSGSKWVGGVYKEGGIIAWVRQTQVEVWAYEPFLRKIYPFEGQSSYNYIGYYDPEIPGLFTYHCICNGISYCQCIELQNYVEDFMEEVCVIVHPAPGVIIHLEAWTEDMYTGKIVIPGQDGRRDTDDDVVIHNGTYDTATRLVKVNAGGLHNVKGGNGGLNLIKDDVGQKFPVQQDSFFTLDGFHYVVPGGGEITRNPDGTHNLPDGTDVYAYLPPMIKIRTVTSGTVLTPVITKFKIFTDGLDEKVFIKVKTLDDVSGMAGNVKITLKGAKELKDEFTPAIPNYNVLVDYYVRTPEVIKNDGVTFKFVKPADETYFFRAVAEPAPSTP